MMWMERDSSVGTNVWHWVIQILWSMWLATPNEKKIGSVWARMRSFVGSGDSEKTCSDKFFIDTQNTIEWHSCLSSTTTYWRHGRSSATQVERVFWLVNGFPTDSAAFPTIELFDCVIYKLIDTATWRWYCSVIGLFYFVVSHNTQTYFRLQGQYAGGLSLLIGRFPLCLLVLFILRKIQPDYERYQSASAGTREVNGACLIANAIFLLDLSWDRNLVDKPVVTRRNRQFLTQWAFAGFLMDAFGGSRLRDFSSSCRY